MQLDHIAIHIPILIRIGMGVGWEHGPRISKFLLSYRNPLLIDIYVSAAEKQALVSASRYNYNAASPYSNAHTNFDQD